MSVPEKARLAHILHRLLRGIERWADKDPVQLQLIAKEIRQQLEDTQTWGLYGTYFDIYPDLPEEINRK